MNSSFRKSVKYEIPFLQQVELEIAHEDKQMELLVDSVLAEENMEAIKCKHGEETATDVRQNRTKPLITVTFIDNNIENGIEVTVHDDLDEPALTHVHTVDEPGHAPVHTINGVVDEPVHAPVHAIDGVVEEPDYAWTGMEPEVEAAILHLYQSREKSRFNFVN